jgi:hypothetical protein
MVHLNAFMPDKQAMMFPDPGYNEKVHAQSPLNSRHGDASGTMCLHHSRV